MGPGGVVWGENRVQKSRETVPLKDIWSSVNFLSSEPALVADNLDRTSYS